MSDPISGDPQIDVDAKKLVAKLEEMDAAHFKNLSTDILGAMVAEFHRLAGLATQHYGIKIKQAIGGVQGSLRNHIKDGIHTDPTKINVI